MTGYIVIHTTTHDEAQADAIADALLNARLAACVQMHAIKSMYRWKGDICTDPEYLLLIKTRRDLYDAVEAKIKSLHSYETPQIIALPIVAGSDAYLDWIEQETGRN